MTGRLRAIVIQSAVVKTSEFNLDVIVHEKIDSTNSWSQRQCKLGKTLPFACFAELQTSGRGRRGKSWVMSPRSNIAMSVCWSFVLSHQQLHLLPLSIALAVVKTLEGYGLKHVQLKWPNDVFVRGKKIAGVLIETQSNQKVSLERADCKQDDSCLAVIIGVGLNYDMSTCDLSLENEAAQALIEITDMQNEVATQNTVINFDREQVASKLLQNIVDTCQNFHKNAQQSLKIFRSSYDFCKNKSVEILLDDQRILSGVAIGVNDAAELLVMIDGEEYAFNSAEVSVKTDLR